MERGGGRTHGDTAHRDGWWWRRGGGGGGASVGREKGRAALVEEMGKKENGEEIRMRWAVL